MADKSISFSKEMMIALMEGKKTQTRRLLHGKPARYEVGDFVRVKEALIKKQFITRSIKSLFPQKYDVVAYEANISASPTFAPFGWEVPKKPKEWKWQKDRLPGIFCPKWASRYGIRITRVRTEIISDISEKDACAEGFADREEFLLYFAKLNFDGDLNAALKAEVFAYDFSGVAYESGDSDEQN